MRQISFAMMHCSLARSLDVVGDWWSPLILRDLYLGLDRFDELATDLGVSRNLLTARLDTLIAGGIVTKEVYCDHPVRYRYLLTQAGRDLIPILLALTAWGDRWAATEDGPPVHIHHDTCMAITTPVVCCSNCMQPLSADDVTVRTGPGGRVAPGTALLATTLDLLRSPTSSSPVHPRTVPGQSV